MLVNIYLSKTPASFTISLFLIRQVLYEFRTICDFVGPTTNLSKTLEPILYLYYMFDSRGPPGDTAADFLVVEEYGFIFFIKIGQLTSFQSTIFTCNNFHQP